MVACTRRPDGDAELVEEQLDRPVTEPTGSAERARGRHPTGVGARGKLTEQTGLADARLTH